jgi:hypothetical protein
VSPDPFALLGLTARQDLTDDDVRAAWRRIAAATHPDRADGGDASRFAAAAAAYTELRTRSGRGEAYADLAATARSRAPAEPRLAAPAPAPPGPASPSPGAPAPGPASPAFPDMASAVPAVRAPAHRFGLTGRIGHGRPVRLGIRLAVAAAVCAVAFVVAGAQPPAVGLSVGAVTWFLLTARRDLAPPRR